MQDLLFLIEMIEDIIKEFNKLPLYNPTTIYCFWTVRFFGAAGGTVSRL